MAQKKNKIEVSILDNLSSKIRSSVFRGKAFSACKPPIIIQFSNQRKFFCELLNHSGEGDEFRKSLFEKQGLFSHRFFRLANELYQMHCDVQRVLSREEHPAWDVYLRKKGRYHRLVSTNGIHQLASALIENPWISTDTINQIVWHSTRRTSLGVILSSSRS